MAADPAAQLAQTREVHAALDALAAEGPIPALWVFDLDYTIWALWCDTHIDPPVHRPRGAFDLIVDASGTRVSLYPETSAVLLWLRHRADVEVAAASRTCAPSVAKQMLRALTLQDARPPPHEGREVPVITLFDYMEIYPGSKVTHFRKLHDDTQIPYDHMIFFDDEYRNQEVERHLGAEFVLVDHGLTLEAVTRGVHSWRRRQPTGHA